MTTRHAYDEEFFNWVEHGAVRSARLLLPFIKKRVNVASVIDIGCGTGSWLAVWQEIGVEDILGIDGGYVCIEQLKIHQQQFEVKNLTDDFALGRQFDIVQCLEVAEHLPQNVSERFVRQLCDLGDVILFSAAQPGQGGEWHINEQPLEFWRSLFRTNGFDVFDLVRSTFSKDTHIEPWYRYNTLIFASYKGRMKLTADVLNSEVHPDQKLLDYGDWKWSVRRAVLRCLPILMVTVISKVNYRFWNKLRKIAQIGGF